MKLIEGKDYYDTAMGYGGIDKTIVFVRNKEKTIPLEELRVADHNFSYIEFGDEFGFPALNSVQIYFCGKLYLGIVAFMRPKKNWMGSLMKTFVFWDYDHFIKVMEEYGWKIQSHKKNAIKYYFEKTGDESQRNVLIEKRITIAVLDFSESVYGPYKREWYIDGYNLKQYQFAKVFDPFRAFQEIEMWLGGVLPSVGSSPPQIVDEKIRLEKRGFDSKWSFRKEKNR